VLEELFGVTSTRALILAPQWDVRYQSARARETPAAAQCRRAASGSFLSRREVTKMTYNKPELVVLDDANSAIQGVKIEEPDHPGSDGSPLFELED